MLDLAYYLLSATSTISAATLMGDVASKRRANKLEGVNGWSCWVHLACCSALPTATLLETGFDRPGYLGASAYQIALMALICYYNFTKRTTHWWRTDQPRHQETDMDHPSTHTRCPVPTSPAVDAATTVELIQSLAELALDLPPTEGSRFPSTARRAIEDELILRRVATRDSRGHFAMNGAAGAHYRVLIVDVRGSRR